MEFSSVVNRNHGTVFKGSLHNMLDWDTLYLSLNFTPFLVSDAAATIVSKHYGLSKPRASHSGSNSTGRPAPS